FEPRPRRTGARPRVRRHPRVDGRLHDDRRPRVHREHPRLPRARRRPRAMGRSFTRGRAPHVPRARTPLARARDAGRRADGGTGGELQDPLARGSSRDLVLPLPRRVAYGERDDRPLPGPCPMRRQLLLAALCFSAVVHEWLTPEHLREEPLLGVLFIVGAVVELAFVVALMLRPSRAIVVGATLMLA